MKARAPNNAGIGQGTVADNDDDEWLRVLNVTLLGIVRAGRGALRHLRSWSSAAIVNPGSITATVGLPERALYSASKGAGLAQTGAMAADHLREGIRVNCVNPGTADTSWIGRLPECAAAPVRLDHGDRTGRRRGHAGPQASFGLGNAHNCADGFGGPSIDVVIDC